MFNKKMIATGAAFIAVMALTAGAVFADVSHPMSLSINNDGSAKITGTVSAVLTNQLSVTSWLGTWTVNTTNAKLSPDLTVLSDIKVGDTVSVSGTVSSGMTVNATKVRDSSLKTHVFVGTVSDLNTGAGTFSLSTENSGNLSVQTGSGTQFFLDGVVSALSHVANGMMVTVSGQLNTTTHVLVADTVRMFTHAHTDAHENEQHDNGFHFHLFGWGW